MDINFTCDPAALEAMMKERMAVFAPTMAKLNTEFAKSPEISQDKLQEILLGNIPKETDND